MLTRDGADATEIQAPDVAGADRGMPGRLDLAAVIRRGAVELAVVQQDIGVSDAGRGAVEVVDRQGAVRRSTPVVVVESLVVLREMHRLGIDVLRRLDGVLRRDARTGEQQPGERAGLAPGIVLVVHEGRVGHVDPVVVVLVAMDRASNL